MEPVRVEFWAFVQMENAAGKMDAKPEKFWIGESSGQVVIGLDGEKSAWLFRESYSVVGTLEFADEYERVKRMVITMAAVCMAANDPSWDKYLWDMGFRP